MSGKLDVAPGSPSIPVSRAHVDSSGTRYVVTNQRLRSGAGTLSVTDT